MWEKLRIRNGLRVLLDPMYRQNLFNRFLHKVWGTRTFQLADYGKTGSLWLVNFFMEMGVRCDAHMPIYFKFKTPLRQGLSEFSLFDKMGGPKGLPFVAFRPRFLFRNDVFVEFQEHKHPRRKNVPTIVFVRDPRDTILSCWKAYGSKIDDPSELKTYMKLIMPYWRTYYQICLDLPNHYIMKFEDCKKNPGETLRGMIDWMGIAGISDYDIKLAADSSTSERAAKAEEIYRQNPKAIGLDFRRWNRSGATDQWKQMPEDIGEEILSECGDLLGALGYGGVKRSSKKAG